MEKTETLVVFTCRGCRETFEFDPVGEHQFVPFPICRIHLITVRRDQTPLLESFDFNLNETSLMIETCEVTTFES